MRKRKSLKSGGEKGGKGRRGGRDNAPRRTALLALKPHAQATQMERMAAPEPFRPPPGRSPRRLPQLVPTDDADRLLAHFGVGRIGVPALHVGRRSAVADERPEPGQEGAGGQVEVAEDVKG